MTNQLDNGLYNGIFRKLKKSGNYENRAFLLIRLNPSVDWTHFLLNLLIANFYDSIIEPLRGENMKTCCRCLTNYLPYTTVLHNPVVKLLEYF